MLYALVSGLVALAMLQLFSEPDKRPSWHKGLCAVGFMVAIGWISTIADEVVGVLRAFGAILGVSEAILGVTVFAMVITASRTHLMIGKFVIRFGSGCGSGENGIPNDGNVRVFRWAYAQFVL
jgi:hypothetical protein